MQKNYSGSADNGFTLVELVVVVLIIGIVTIGAIATASPILKKGRITATESNMQEVIEVLSVYAQNNNRLPCPADPDQSSVAQPYGFERGSGPDGADLGSCSALASPEGIIPFKTLGISEDLIKDGWKNYITYRVSPVFTLNPDDTAREVHKRCRTVNKWVFNEDSHNAPKARFCCPGGPPAPNTDIIIRDGLSRIWPYDRDATPGNFEDSETPYEDSPPAFNSITENITVPAVVLVSHGMNGAGAFMTDGNRIGGPMGVDEGENQDDDIDFIVRPMAQVNGNNYFDDIVAWRTQDQLYAETGKATCFTP